MKKLIVDSICVVRRLDIPLSCDLGHHGHKLGCLLVYEYFLDRKDHACIFGISEMIKVRELQVLDLNVRDITVIMLLIFK